jgi:hypothetical protein
MIDGFGYDRNLLLVLLTLWLLPDSKLPLVLPSTAFKAKACWPVPWATEVLDCVAVLLSAKLVTNEVILKSKIPYPKSSIAG